MAADKMVLLVGCTDAEHLIKTAIEETYPSHKYILSIPEFMTTITEEFVQIRRRRNVLERFLARLLYRE